MSRPAAAGDPVVDLDLARIRRRVSEDEALGEWPNTGPQRIAAVRAAVARAVRGEGVVLPAASLAVLVRDLTDTLVGLGPVQALLRDPAVTDVMVNGPGAVWVERDGRLQLTALRFDSAEALLAAVRGVIGPLGLRLDHAQPTVDARLPDGSRLHAVLPPLAPEGPLVTIRRFPSIGLGWAELAHTDAVPAAAAELLRTAVRDRRAVVVAGRTGTGKTTLLGALLAEVGADERVVVIEEAPELRPQHHHTVRLLTRPPSLEGGGEVTIRDLVRQALRMRPTRIVVGEVRGVELVDVLQALATGHEGCMTTVHARAAQEALVRLEGMALLAGIPLEAARAQLEVGLDVLVVLGRAPDGRRGVVQVAEVEPRGGEGPLRCRELWRRTAWQRMSGPAAGARS